jgi:hypothetical protein
MKRMQPWHQAMAASSGSGAASVAMTTLPACHAHRSTCHSE